MNLTKKEKEKLSNKEYQYFKTQPIQTKDLDALFEQYVPPEEISDKDRKKIIERNKKEKARIKKSETNLEKKIAEHNWKGMPTPKKAAINPEGRLISKSESHRKIKFDQKKEKLVGKKGSLTIPKNISMTPRFSYTLDEYNNLPLQDSETQNIIKYMLKRGGPPVKGIIPSKRKRGGGKGTKRKKRTSEPPTPPRVPRPRITNTEVQYPDPPPTGYEWIADPMGNMVLIQTEESFQGGKRHRKTRKKRGGWQRKYNEDNIGAFYYCQNQGNNSVYREKNIITGRWDELRPKDEWKIIEMENSREYDPILKLFDESNPDFGEFRVEAQQLCNRGYVPLKRNAPKTGAGRKKKTRKKQKKQFLYNPNNPKKSFDVYIDKNPNDTIPIKYTTVNDVKQTIKKLERLFKNKKYPHKRIWQVGMIMKVRLEAMNKYKKTRYKKAKYIYPRFRLAKKYFEFLGKRSKKKSFVERKKMVFKFPKQTMKGGKWTKKYKKSINCKNPKGFSQKQYCKYGRNKNKTRKNKKKKKY